MKLVYMWETQDEAKKQKKADAAKNAFQVYIKRSGTPAARKYALWEINDIDQDFTFWKTQRARLGTGSKAP